MASIPTAAERPHERLQAWTACHELAVAVYQATSSWTDAEHQVLAESARDAARRAPLSIMIGAYSSPAVFRSHLREARGKLVRLSAILDLARELKALTPDGFTALEIRRDHAERLTTGLWRSTGKTRA